MKKAILFSAVLLSGLAIAQTGKVGVNTQAPTENLDVKGTLRVRELPAKDAQSAIYTDAKNPDTPQNAKAQTFTPTRTVVTNDNGVVGYVPGLPITALPDIKLLEYKSVTTNIDDQCPEASVITIGNLSFRFNAKSRDNNGQFLEYRINQSNYQAGDFVNSYTIAIGSGGLVGRGRTENAAEGNWYKVGDQNVTIDHHDFQIGQVITTLAKESYRISVGMTNEGTSYSQGINWPRRVTLFVEKLVDKK